MPTSLALRPWFLVACALAAIAPQQGKSPAQGRAPASSKAADDGEFGKALDAVRRLEDAGKWREASAALENLLADTGDTPFVRGRRAEILVEVKRIAVRSAVPQPDPATLIKGKLLAWDKKSGDLSLLYEPFATDDFVPSGEAWVLPVDFDGPVTLHLEGDAFDFSGRDLLQLFIGVRGDDATVVAIGAESDAGRTRYPSIIKIERRRGTRQETLFTGEKAPQYGKKYELELAIGGDDITVTCNHVPLARTKRPANLAGRVGVYRSPRIARFAIRGRASTAWLQGKLDAATRADEEKFLATWNADDHVPKWLSAAEAPREAPAAPRHLPPDQLPWRMVPPHVKFANEIYELVDAGHANDAIDRINKLKLAELPEELRSYLSFVVLDSIAKLPKYESWVEDFLKKHPDFEFAHRTRAHCLMQAGKLDAAAAELASMQGHCDDRTGVAEELVEVDLLLERVDDAAEALRTAAAAGAASPQLAGLQQVVVNCRRGPDLPRRFSQKSDHFACVTDMDAKTPELALRQLEESYRICVLLFGEPGGSPRPLPVYLFAGRAGYESYTGIFSGLAHSTAGMYSPLFKQLLVWNLPEREETLRTLRHEATHQFLDRAGVVAPVWVNEGFACYVQLIASSRNSDLKAGAVDRTLLRIWAKARSHALKIDFLLNARPDEFYRHAAAAYPEAWGLVHYLRHGAPKEGTAPEHAPQRIGERLLKALHDRVGMEEINAKTFEGVDLDALEENFLLHLDLLCDKEGIR